MMGFQAQKLFLRLRITEKLCNCHSNYCASLFLCRCCFWINCQKIFGEHFKICYQGSVWPRSDSFLGHTKRCFHKNCSLSCYSQHVWHMTQLISGKQFSRHPKKDKKRKNRKQPNSLKHVQLVNDKTFKG